MFLWCKYMVVFVLKNAMMVFKLKHLQTIHDLHANHIFPKAWLESGAKRSTHMHGNKGIRHQPSVNQSQYNIYSYIFCNLHPTYMYKDMISIATYIWYTISVHYIMHLSNPSLPGQPQKQQRSDRQGSKSRNASAGHSCAAAKVHRKRNSNAWKSCGEDSGKFLVEKFLGNPLLTP